MQYLIRRSLGLASTAALAFANMPFLGARAEQIKTAQAPEAVAEKSSSIKSRSGFYLTAGAGASYEAPIIDNRTSTYESPTLGPTSYQHSGELKLGYGFAADPGVGYDFGHNLRAELTYLFNTYSTGTDQLSGTLSYAGGNDTFSGKDTLSGRVYKNSVLASLYYDIPTKSRWVPYFGGGLGWTNVSTTDIVYNYDVALGSGGRAAGSKTVPGGNAGALGYQAKIGVSYIATKSTDLYVEANYLGNTSVDLGSGTSFGSFNSYGLKAGFRYRFGK
ncbi:MAG: outer membrane beta-barrel protein [Cyanobium sp. LacPavin_0818_WC50_MAG_67_9]|nr:outer membrane beta-barrel protein [Cyanobium sp. LacPavin_0818_WC50_MAG_67_9]